VSQLNKQTASSSGSWTFGQGVGSFFFFHQTFAQLISCLEETNVQLWLKNTHFLSLLTET